MTPARQKVNARLQTAESRKPGWKSALTKQRLAAAAEESFATLGYEKTGLREIAAAVGVNPALVKRYFGSKEGLFEQAFAGVLTFEKGVPADRGDFGTHMVDLLTTQSINVLPILLHTGSVPAIKNKALQMHREKILVPLAAWLGGTRRQERALKITMLCTGYVTCLRLLPMEGAASPSLKKWIAEALQRIVDDEE